MADFLDRMLGAAHLWGLISLIVCYGYDRMVRSAVKRAQHTPVLDPALQTFFLDLQQKWRTAKPAAKRSAKS